MDGVDRKILAELAVDGRLSHTDVAERVQLSLSACHRRVRALEKQRVITGYKAVLSPQALGLHFEALVFVTMAVGTRDVLDAFEQALVNIPDIVSATRLFGQPDHLLRVVTRDAEAYQQLYDEHLTTLPGVQRLTSTLVMREVVAERPLPL
jgi:DNA-binding Lrp family transcriptional regulator